MGIKIILSQKIFLRLELLWKFAKFTNWAAGLTRLPESANWAEFSEFRRNIELQKYF